MDEVIRYRITDFKVKNFRGIQEAELTGIPAEAQWIFLTGKNGYGKTSLLQAIFIGVFGSNLDDSKLIDESEFEIGLKLVGEIVLSNEVLNKTLKRPNYIPIAAYGVSRLSITHSQSSNTEKDTSSKHYSLFNPDGVLLSIENELKNLLYRSDSKDIKPEQSKGLRQRHNEVIEALIQLMPNIASITVNASTDRIEYIEKDENGEPLLEKRTFLELASGNKSIIAIIGDMIIRLFRAQPEIKAISELGGIVIIDELDLHLHPEWQKKLPGLLSQVFPKVQFIVSTHSPIPFLGAPKNSVFLKVNRTVEEGITVEKLDINIEDLTPNLILSSEIFGFTEIFPVTHDPEKRIRTEDTMEEVAATDLLEKRLKSYFGSESEQKLKELYKKDE